MILAGTMGAMLVAGAEALSRTAQGGPVVVELYQSQGCSSCPPANALLNAMARRSDLIPLSFGVTYWDQLGWKDTFASADYTRRQWEYARANRRDNVATPQFVVGGRFVISGNDSHALERAIATARSQSPATTISASSGKVRVAAGQASTPASVWLVRYDPHVLEVRISRGENDGRTLPHRFVVTGLWRIGTWNGRAATFAVPKQGGSHAILVQQGTGGPIVAAARI
jgi:hypothetical protein